MKTFEDTLRQEQKKEAYEAYEREQFTAKKTYTEWRNELDKNLDE